MKLRIDLIQFFSFALERKHIELANRIDEAKLGIDLFCARQEFFNYVCILQILKKYIVFFITQKNIISFSLFSRNVIHYEKVFWFYG